MMKSSALKGRLVQDIARSITKRLAAHQAAEPSDSDERILVLLDVVSDVMGGVYFALGMTPDEYAETAAQAAAAGTSSGALQQATNTGIYEAVVPFVPVVHLATSADVSVTRKAPK